MAFALQRSSTLGRTCVSHAPIHVRTSRPTRIVSKSTQSEIGLQVQKALKEAEDACAKGTSTQECAVAWDNAEEVLAAASHKKEADKLDPALNDPLEAFCASAPDADECRVYED